MPVNVPNWTAEDFERHVGCLPEVDDLDRVNCAEVGQFGHHGCGVCEHNRPKFMTCFRCQESAVAPAKDAAPAKSKQDIIAMCEEALKGEPTDWFETLRDVLAEMKRA